MRLKAVSAAVILILCLSLLPILAPPLASRVQANPMETLNVDFGEANWIQNGNSRPFTLGVSEKVIQFTRPDLIVGNNASGSFYTVSKMSWPVSGDLTGTVLSDLTSVVVTWDGLPFAKGYTINTITFDDGYSNTFSGIMVMDIDFTSLPTGTGRIVSTSGTGAFSGKRLIGTCSASSNGTMTATLRCYSGSEISSPQAFSGTGTISGGGGGLLGTSTGPLSYDEFLQFSGANGIFAKDCPASYQTSPIINGPVTGALTGTLSQSINGCAVFSGQPLGPSTVVGGWNVGKFSFSAGNGTITGVLAGDSSGEVYMFALKEAATGLYAGRDYYATAMGGTTGDPNNPTGVSYSGSLYTLTPAEGIATATGTGTATLVPSAGTMENLVAVSEASVPSGGKPTDVEFPHGFFEFEITGLTPGQSATLTITLPSAIPTYAQYWKYGPTPSVPSGEWYQIPMGDNDGDNAITITLVDGGSGDDDLTANGIVVDQGGPGWPGPTGGGGGGVPVFPSIYIGIAAALGAGILAYFARRRLAVHN